MKYVANTYSHEELSDRLRQLNRATQLKLDSSKLYMGPAEIKELLERGMALGCHGRTHSNLAHSTDIEEEVASAKELLQALSKREIATFAYPFGDADSFNEVSHEYLKKHFRYVCTTLPRVNKQQDQSIYHRICSYEMPGEKLIMKLLLGI